jgi:cytochrome c
MRLAALAGLLALCAVAPACAAPDARRGEQVYSRCLACHALAYDRVGPRHCGLFGRPAGSVPGFAYSPAMKASGITWNERTLERFLAGPLQTVPGTTMTYDGVPDAADRADLIAYLKLANRSAACAGPGG